jgi:hypothetical protein
MKELVALRKALEREMQTIPHRLEADCVGMKGLLKAHPKQYYRGVEDAYQWVLDAINGMLPVDGNESFAREIMPPDPSVPTTYVDTSYNMDPLAP